jgi:iduronate 2-sulfatase
MARELRQHYFASVTYTDEQVGRLLGQVDTSGYADDTIVMMFGDHGWQLGKYAPHLLSYYQ